MNTIERLVVQARNNHGIQLFPMQVREVAGTILNMDRAIRELNIIQEQYVIAYGDDVLKHTIGALNGDYNLADESEEQPSLFAEDAVFAEVVDEEGQSEGGPGIHPQVAEGQGSSVEVPEVPELSDDPEGQQNGPYVL